MRSVGMGGHQATTNIKDEWLTPPSILAALGQFDLDPCSPISRPWPTAATHYTIENDGLALPWFGRVWCNPPYGSPKIVGPWMRKMAAHNCGIALIFARTETELFFETVWPCASAILFFKGRLYFHHVTGEAAEANAGAPSVLIAYGAEDAQRLKTCGLPGQYIDLGGRLSAPPY